MAFRFATAFYKLLPPWLTEGEGELVAGAFGIMLDVALERLRLGLESRHPTTAGPSALALIGSDRGIPRGRTETEAHYAARLLAWRYPRGHRTRGSAFALLEQVSEYWGGMLAQTRDVNETTHQRTAAGVETVAYGDTWDWDGDAASWSRFWLILFPNPDVPAIVAWGLLDGSCWGGDMSGGPGYTLGQQGVTPDDVNALRRLFRTPIAWKPAGTLIDWAIVQLDPASTAPALAPGGNWATVQGRATAPLTVRFWRMR